MKSATSTSTDNEVGRRVAAPRSAANVGRLLWGVAFLVSSVVNLAMTLPNPELYGEFADLTFLPWYRSLLLNVAVPHATLVSTLVVFFEFVTGLMILGKGRAVRWGLIATGVWILFVTPAMGWYTLFSPALLIIPGLLLRFDYRWSPLDLVVPGRQAS